MNDTKKLEWLKRVMKNLRDSYIRQGKEDIVVVLDHLIEMSERKDKDGSVSA